MRLKAQYGLNYDHSGFGSGLIDWYNQLIDKSYDELDITDVSKMLRQNILKEVAIEKAMDLFIQDPFDGEYKDGDLLHKMISLDMNEIRNSDSRKLVDLIEKLKKTYSDFDWITEEDKEQYSKNLDVLYSSLTKI